MTDFSNDTSEPTKPTLSQSSAKKKLLIALPLTLIGADMWSVNINGSMGLCIIMGAYALVGAIELVGGQSLFNAARNWDSLPSWKKGLISALVIGIAIGCMLLTILGYARMTESA